MVLTELERRKARVVEWVTFRRKYLFSQVRLAEALGVSRRTVQYVEDVDAEFTPTPEMLSRFALLKSKYESEHGEKD